MQINQNIMDHIRDRVQKGEITIDQANVEKVLSQRVLLVTAKMPVAVRKALNAAVKRGELGHAKKDGRKPEAYFHPTFEGLAKSERRDHERATLAALAATIVRPYEFE